MRCAARRSLFSASSRHSSSARTIAGMMTFLNSGTLSGTLPLIAASVCSPADAAASRAEETSSE